MLDLALLAHQVGNHRIVKPSRLLVDLLAMIAPGFQVVLFHFGCQHNQLQVVADKH